MTLLGSILGTQSQAPHIESVSPAAAMPGGEVDLLGLHLAAIDGVLPIATIGDTEAHLVLSSATRATVRIPDGALPGDIRLHTGNVSNAVAINVAVPVAENVHPVTNPVVDADSNIYTTLSGTRGQQTPVSIFRIDQEFGVRPFAREILNPTALAFDREGNLFCSSRADGTVYRITPAGAVSSWIEGMGIATGLAFDKAGNLFVGDRSGSIFKISPTKEIFVHATLEQSVAAYHLAILDDEGTLLVTAPTTASSDVIHAISPSGEVSLFFRGLGRPQGLAVSATGDVYVAASHMGRRGIHRITPQKEASLAIAGNNLIGLAFAPDGVAVLATRDALYEVALGVEGRTA